MPRFRFGVLAAVSSDPQAREDKFSLSDQVEFSRSAGLSQGGIEATGPFILDGYSRTGYVNLSDAVEDIPPLAEAVEAAEQNHYDVLIVDNIERLGDLAPMLYTLFSKHRKQIHSARQSGRIHDPKTYNPYDDESASIMIHVEGIIQKYRVNKIRRGWNIGVPARIDKGLHPLSLTYGYRLTGKDQPAAQVPEICSVLIELKDMMLSGVTYTDLCRYADSAGLKPPRAAGWSRQVVKRILLNPFYAGIVRFGEYRRGALAPRSEWKQAKGKHEPLWDEATHYALLAEAKRRMDGKRNYAAKYPFSGLTVCGTCARKISKHGKPPYEYLACDTHSHWSMRYEDAFEHLVNAVVNQFHQRQLSPREPIDLAPLRAELERLLQVRARIQEGWEAGLYTLQEFGTKINKTQEDEDRILLKIQQAEEDEASWQSRYNLDVDIDVLAKAIRVGDPSQANHKLSTLIDHIALSRVETRVVWRG